MNAVALDFPPPARRARILRYLTHLVGDGEAEDLTQAVMTKVSEGLAGIRGDSSPSTWIYRRRLS